MQPRALIGGTLNGFFLNFNQNEGIDFPGSATPYTGAKAIFGDQGNDWIVGGNGANTIFGGSGNDLIDGRRNLTLDNGQNDLPDNNPYYNSVVFGGSGSDILFAGGYYDRLIGGPNGFTIDVLPVAPVIVPYTIAPAPKPTPLPPGVTGLWVPVVTQVENDANNNNNAPDLLQYLFQLGAADGGDQLYTNFAVPAVGHLSGLNQPQNGELQYEIGLAQSYFTEIQPNSPDGNFANNNSVVAGSFTASSGSLGPVTPVAGSWTLSTTALQAAPSSVGGAAIATFYTGSYLPDSFTVTGSVTPGAAASGSLSNGYLLFDYVSATDFKFAGVDATTGNLEIGHYNGSAWIIDASNPAGIKAGQAYNLTLSIAGDTATLSITGHPAFSYSWHLVNGVDVGLNYGMVGLATDNATAGFSNVAVQVPVAPPTWKYQTTFSSGPLYFDTPTGGTWSINQSGYTGAAPTAGFAIAPIDLSLALGVSPNTFSLQTGSTIDIATKISQIGGRAGIVFNMVNGTFDFAALLYDTQQVVLGHYTPSSGFVIDAFQSYKVANNLTLEIVADRDLVNVDVNGSLVLSYSYGRPVTCFGFGLLSWTGSNLFGSLTVSTNDPHLSQPFAPPPPLSAQPSVPSISWNYMTNFSGGPLYFDTPIGGTWSIGPSSYTGVAPANGVGIVPLDPALAFGLPAGSFAFQSNTSVELQTTISTIGGRAGLVFDLTDGGSFKFAALLYDQQKIAIGHYTPGGGFVIDAAQSYTVTNNLLFTIETDANMVSVYMNNRQVLSYSYNAVVTGGQFGLLSWTGTNVFRNLTVIANDPELRGRPDLPQPQVLVQPAVSVPQWIYSTNFTNGPIYLDAPVSGSWSFGKNGYTGTAAAGGIAIAPIDPGLALGLQPGTFTFPDGSSVDIKTVLNPISGRAGIVFDMTANGSFKFAELLYDQQKVVIGHYTTASGFVFDATESYAFQNSNVYFEVVLHGDVVAVNILSGSPFALTYNYGTVVTHGQFGLMVSTGTATFFSLVIDTDAPNLVNAQQHMLAASAPTGPAFGVTDLTMAEVNSELPAAIDRLTAMYSLDAAEIALLSVGDHPDRRFADNGFGLTRMT